MNKPFANVSFKDLSRVAAYLGNKLCSEYDKQFPNKYCLDCFANDEDARPTVAFVIWKILSELKEFGELKTHPSDLLGRAIYLMRHYEYSHRYYPNVMDWLVRAFARRFSHFEDLPRKELKCAFDPWKVYCFSDVPTIKRSDRAARKITVKNIPELEKIGKAFVCEEWADEFTEIAGFGGIIVDRWREIIMIPFSTKSEAVLFITQLADMLNARGESDCPEMAQFIRDIVAQVPVENMRMKLECEAAEQAEREEKERKIRSNGTHVYVLDFGNGLVKIGISNNVRSRIAQAKTFGQITVKFAVTEKGFDYGKACGIENDCHHFFKGKGVTKEVFRVPYDEAKARLEKHAPVIEFNEQERET